METSPSGETGRGGRKREGAAQACGAQVWVRAWGSGLEESLLSMTLWWDVLQTTKQGKEADEAFSEQPEEGSMS